MFWTGNCKACPEAALATTISIVSVGAVEVSKTKENKPESSTFSESDKEPVENVNVSNGSVDPSICIDNGYIVGEDTPVIRRGCRDTVVEVGAVCETDDGVVDKDVEEDAGGVKTIVVGDEDVEAALSSIRKTPANAATRNATKVRISQRSVNMCANPHHGTAYCVKACHVTGGN